jgi:hypothetical protein
LNGTIPTSFHSSSSLSKKNKTLHSYIPLYWYQVVAALVLRTVFWTSWFFLIIFHSSCQSWLQLAFRTNWGHWVESIQHGYVIHMHLKMSLYIITTMKATLFYHSSTSNVLGLNFVIGILLPFSSYSATWPFTQPI